MFKRAVYPLPPGVREEWRPYRTINRIVLVSNLGRVRGPQMSYRKTFVTKAGYEKVFGANVHRMVAEIFVAGRSEERNIVNHIDCRKLNNKYTNLAWVTGKENAEHARRMGRYESTTGANHWTSRQPQRRKACEENGRAKLTRDQVVYIRSSKASSAALSRELGVSAVMVSKIRRGLAWRF